MIIISCDGLEWWREKYLIPDIDNIEQLVSEIQKNGAIKCFEVREMCFRIIVMDKLREKYINLDQYKNFSDVTDCFYIMTDSEYKTLTENQCSTCAKRERGFGFDCKFVKSDSGCQNYEQTISNKFIGWLRKLFNVVMKSK